MCILGLLLLVVFNILSQVKIFIVDFFYFQVQMIDNFSHLQRIFLDEFALRFGAVQIGLGFIKLWNHFFGLLFSLVSCVLKFLVFLCELLDLLEKDHNLLLLLEWKVAEDLSHELGWLSVFLERVNDRPDFLKWCKMYFLMGALLTVGTGSSIHKMLTDAREMKDMTTGEVSNILSEFVETDGAIGDFVEILVIGGCFCLHEI